MPVLVAAPLAVLATAGAVTFGVLAQDGAPAPRDVAAARLSDAAAAAVSEALAEGAEERADARAERVSRDAARTELAVTLAQTPRWTTTALNLWSASGASARKVGEIEAGKKVLITGRTADDRVEVVVDGVARWVTAGYLSEDKPLAATAGLSTAPCPDGSVENGLTAGAVAVYRAVCHAFPQITTYGGWDDHGEHSSGKALDIMTSDVALGDAIAAYLQRNAAALGLFDIIWRQRIWTPERASEGWRPMSDRGSATANHYDHVHVAVY
ncbi:hypothetical protein GCM10022215_12530 [Nocardioides fonticola]|uniref:ARB-07466-like C-terminal domain-containing protein n=1 Tax=Nocardioides fonticola TaxID=450363 RepID=A0ABP7XFV3_9ACTN